MRRAVVFDFNDAGRQQDTAPRTAPSSYQAASDFQAFMEQHGLQPGAVSPTGDRPARCAVEGDGQGRKSGWYVYYADNPPAGACGNWKTGEEWQWCAKSESTRTAQEDREYHERIERVKRLRDEERGQMAADAARKAADKWSKGTEVTAHPYLQKKGVKSFGLKMLNGKLLVPMMDATGNIRSMQEIDGTGDKKFLFGGEKKGRFFEIAGTGMVTAVAEGYATAATIHMATGWRVLVAFDAGNIESVVDEYRAAHPEARMVICGDDDQWKDRNAGREKATKCATDKGLKVVFPRFSLTENKPTDFNDLAKNEGIEAVRSQLMAATATKRDVRQWGLDKYAGPAPARRWLIEDIMPCGSVFVLAAMGDAGKGMLSIDLALKVAGKAPLSNGDANDFNVLQAFGHNIKRQGPVVILSAEDNRDEIHRRLENIKVGDAHDIFIVPLPNSGGPLAAIVPGKHGPEVSAEWLEVRDQLMEIKPVLIVIDPLVSFIMADINSDPAVGAFTMGHMAQLAQETDAAVVLIHHLAKCKTNISTPEEARAMIRGTTAIVDNSRAAYVLWGIDEKSSRATCSMLGVEWKRNRVMRGCLVKSNGPGDREIKTWIRNDIGLLEVRNEQIRSAASVKIPAVLEVLKQACAEAAERGQPFTKTGASGLFVRRQELPEEIRDVSKSKLDEYAQMLLDKKELFLCAAAKGGKAKKWLDVADGKFAMGVGELASGAQERSR